MGASRRANAVVVLVVGIALSVSGLLAAVAVEPPSQSPRVSVPLVASPSLAIAKERVKLSGQLPTTGRRPVMLQRKAGRKWTEVASKRSTRQGKFAFQVRAAAAGAQVYRVTAPKTNIKGKKLAAVTTTKRKVRTVAQQVVLAVPDETPLNREFTVEATFSPARPGRPVRIQELRDGAWVTLAATRQNTEGVAVAELVGVTEGSYQYRALTTKRKGAAALASTPRTLTVVKDQTEVSDTAEPLTETEVESISDFDRETGMLVFDDNAPASVAEIDAGDIVPVPPRPGAPSGALVKVMGKISEGGSTVLTTVPASIPEVVENTPDDQSQIALGVTDVPEITPLTDGIVVEVVDEGVAGGGLLGRAARLDLSATTLEGPKQTISINKKFKETSGGLTTAINVSGSLELTPIIDMAVDVDWWTVKSYKLATGFRVDDNLHADGSVTFKKGWSQDLFTVSSSHAGSIGPVPVWVTLTGKVTLVASAQGQISAQYTWKRSGKAMVGVKGTKVGGYVPEPYFESPSTSSELLLANATGTMRGAVVGSVQADLYSAGGPFVTLGYEAVATFQDSTTAPLSCELYHRPTASIGLRSGELISKITGGDPATLAEYPFSFAKKTISACPKPPPPPPDLPVISTTSLPDGTVGQEYAAQLEVEDGRDGTWTVGGLPDGLTVDEATGAISGIPTTDGASTLQVGFTDGEGLSDAAELELVVLPGESEPVTPTWKDIQARWGTSCGIRGDDSLWCWGENNGGQVGDGTFTDRRSPVRVEGSWRMVTFGGYNTCGIRTDDTGWCWGRNSTGSVGDGTTTDRATPTKLPGSWKTLAMSNSTTCGIQTDDTGWCWGWDGDGQVGDGTSPASKHVPVKLPGTWQSLELNNHVVCGVQTDDSGWCWGDNDHGQVGDGSTIDRNAPFELPGLWKDVSPAKGAPGATCGIWQNGAGWCWGYNARGQVGDGTIVNRLSPFRLPGTWSELTPGGAATCGVQTDSTGWCWGRNATGQLGDGTTTDRHSPVQLPGAWRTIDVEPNMSTWACGIHPDDTASCWGDNGFGQLGNGTTIDRSTPGLLPGTWKTLQLGFAYVCGVKADTTGWCWGTNYLGQLGDGSTTDRRVPTELT